MALLAAQEKLSYETPFMDMLALKGMAPANRPTFAPAIEMVREAVGTIKAQLASLEPTGETDGAFFALMVSKGQMRTLRRPTVGEIVNDIQSVYTKTARMVRITRPASLGGGAYAH